MPQYVIDGLPKGRGVTAAELEALQAKLNTTCQWITELGMSAADFTLYVHRDEVARGRPVLMITTPGLRDTGERSPEVLRRFAAVILDVVVGFCERKLPNFERVMVYVTVMGSAKTAEASWDNPLFVEGPAELDAIMSRLDWRAKAYGLWAQRVAMSEGAAVWIALSEELIQRSGRLEELKADLLARIANPA